MTGVWILLFALAAATAFGLWRRATDGRMKSTGDGRPVPLPDDAPSVDLHDAVHDEHGGDVLTAAAIGTSLGEVATLVQFSSAFCQPCRATRRILDEVAQMVPGVTHVEIAARPPCWCSTSAEPSASGTVGRLGRSMSSRRSAMSAAELQALRNCPTLRLGRIGSS